MNNRVRHPAYDIPFDTLLQGLMGNASHGLINVQEKGNLRLFNYTPECTFTKSWNVFTRVARGLILDIVEKKIVAASLPKFFNYLEEVGVELPNESFEVTEKIDGSCILCWFYDGKWNTSTRGSFSSDQAIWAQDYLDKNVDKENLIRGTTYVFEVVYPANRIVVSYDFQGLVLLTAYNRDGYEYTRTGLEWLSLVGGVRLVKVREYKMVDEILKICENLPLNEEGFVLRFESGLRVKIKGAQYIRMHRIVSNVTPLRIWDMLRAGDDLDIIAKELPEEHLQDFNQIRSLITETYNTLLRELKELHETLKDKSDRDTGMFIQNKYSTSANSEPRLEGFVFQCRKNNFLDEVEKPSKSRDRFFNMFRPKNNHLKGFVPRNNLNRFDDDN